MLKAIKDMSESCDTCARYGTTAPKEPMQSLPISTQAWDIFSFEKEDYLVTVYHFSDWIEVEKLPDTLSTTVVEKTKGHFSRYRIPSIVHTDNGPQFISRESKDLSSTCNFKHTTSSPYYAKGNGRAEAALKVAKAMLKNSEDFQLALLLYWYLWTYCQISKMEGPRFYMIVTPHGKMSHNCVYVRPATPPSHNYNPRLKVPSLMSKFPFG